MKRKRYSKVIFSLIVISAFLWSGSTIVLAESVQTNGDIVIRENLTEPSTEPTTEPTKPIASSEPPVAKKPTGRLPSTGELVTMSVSISGILLVIGIFLYRMFNKKKSTNTQGKEQ
ncbi:LPXTG cell wall anchor domain-containing protein [Enterococcus crotali]|uniref:LPXTG cell wall anchor domain-containing protein n=1 Tax=Enterococcus crotali TaxID=1453587 RepID=UPI00046E6793|nr:LPXTG cell wall anchor domain-containing protein [Enterococcus crotali]OTP50643.1 hypothetical protein A5881_002067 [Enterococcus termitis]